MNTRRRFWQIQINTAIMLILVTGGLIWANTTTRIFRGEMKADQSRGYEWQGWPAAVYQKDFPFVSSTQPTSLTLHPQWHFSIGGLLVNLVAGAGILTLVWRLSELRRRF